MNHEITYSRYEDYLLQDIRLKDLLQDKYPTAEPAGEEYPALGSYGRMRLAFLKEQHPMIIAEFSCQSNCFLICTKRMQLRMSGAKTAFPKDLSSKKLSAGIESKIGFNCNTPQLWVD